jgi:hypothetical protein
VGDGLGTTIKYLGAAAGIGLGSTIKYLRGAPAALNERRREQRPAHYDQVPREPKCGRGQQLGQGPHTQTLGSN